MPQLAAAIPWVLAVAGTAVSTYAAVAQGEAAEDAAKDQNEAAKAQAQSAQDAAALEAGQVRRENLLRLGKNRAATAKSGVLIEDSAADVMYDASIQGEIEAMSVLYSGATEASYQRSKGRMALKEGKAAKRAGYVSGAGTLIGGASNTVSKMPSFSKASASSGRSALYNERGPQ